jgi:hypothetical protein
MKEMDEPDYVILAKINMGIQEMNGLLKKLIDDIGVWKEWDKKHHLEEKRLNELFEKVAKYLFEE